MHNHYIEGQGNNGGVFVVYGRLPYNILENSSLTVLGPFRNATLTDTVSKCSIIAGQFNHTLQHSCSVSFLNVAKVDDMTLKTKTKQKIKKCQHSRS